MFSCACQGRRVHQSQTGHKQRKSIRTVNSRNIAPDAQISRGQKDSRVAYINQRVDLVVGCLVRDAVGMVVPCNKVGGTRPYARTDLKYDLKRELIVVGNSTSTDDAEDSDGQSDEVHARDTVPDEITEDGCSEDDVVRKGGTKRRIVSSDDEDDDYDDNDAGPSTGAGYAVDDGDLDDDSERELLRALGCDDVSSSSSAGSGSESGFGD